MKIVLNEDQIKTHEEKKDDQAKNDAISEEPTLDISDLNDSNTQDSNNQSDYENDEYLNQEITEDLKKDISKIIEKNKYKEDSDFESEINKDENKNNKKNKKEKNKKSSHKKRKRIENSEAETNEDYYENYKIRLRNNKIYKNIVTGVMISFVVILVGFNIYFTFFREVRSDLEIAQNVSLINGLYGYPEEGIESYLKDNFSTILVNSGLKNEVGGNVDGTFRVDNINVLFVTPKSSTDANVYFAATISTDTGSSTHQFLLNIEYDKDTFSYKPTTDLMFSLPKNLNSSDKDTEYKSAWTFDGLTKQEDEEVASLETFLDNFYIILYNEDKAVTNYYDGSDKIGDPNFSYIEITGLEYYTSINNMGANVKVTYKLSSSEGLVYELTSYMNVEKLSTGSYMIHSIY